MQNETINQRIKNLRRALDLTQQGFADRIGMKRNTVASYEIDRNGPSNSVISLICKEFNVNETWLRTGDGPMFTKAPNTALEELAVDFYLDSFDEALLDEYLHLTPNNRKAVRTFFYRVLMKSIGDKKPEELLKTEMGYPTLEEAAALVAEAKRSVMQDYFAKTKQELEDAEEIAPSLSTMEQEARAEAEQHTQCVYEQILSEKKAAAEMLSESSEQKAGGGMARQA